MIMNIFKENTRLGERLDKLKDEFQKIDKKKKKTEQDEALLKHRAEEIKDLQERFDETMGYFFPGANL